MAGLGWCSVSVAWRNVENKCVFESCSPENPWKVNYWHWEPMEIFWQNLETIHRGWHRLNTTNPLLNEDGVSLLPLRKWSRRSPWLDYGPGSKPRLLLRCRPWLDPVGGMWASSRACRQWVWSQQPTLLGKQGLAPALDSETVLAPLQSSWPCFALINQAIGGAKRVSGDVCSSVDASAEGRSSEMKTIT